jgi:hypothetical protein
LSARRNQVARDYVAAFARDGSHAFIANLGTRVDTLDWGGQVLPVTINDGEGAGTFVCSPRISYFDYTHEELSHFPNPALVPVLRGIVGLVGLLTRPSKLDQIVHLNNWMMSTNLPVELDPALVPDQTRTLVARFPHHMLALRSLTRRYSGPLMTALERAGWVMIASRQIFVVDDVAKASLTRRDARNDDRIWRGMAFQYEELNSMCVADAARITELYAMLYLEKYSRLNPVYTPRFVALTHEIGMIRYLVLRDAAGRIQGFGGMHAFGRNATMPLIGYDTGLPREMALYRLVCHAGSLHASRHGLRFNMSSGAGRYKLTRGAEPEIEFTAYHLRHLPALRRLPFGVLRLVADRIGVPLLRRYQL